MKVNKTLSLDYSVVQELQLMKNQSAFVNAAILKRLGGMMSVDPEITTNQLMAALTPNNSEFLPKGNIPMQATPAAGQQQAAPQPSGAVPSWAQQ